MTTFSDIIKKSVMQELGSGNITTVTILLTLGLTTLLGIYLFFVYYFATKKTFYSKSFNISLVLIAIVTASIILAMQSNLVISLGMVGALSIVRFRTAIKDPMDLIFLFWSISLGIICGASMFKIALIMSAVLTILLFVLEKLNLGHAPAILIINFDNMDKEKEIIDLISSHSKLVTIKARNISKEKIDMIVSCKPSNEQELLSKIREVDSVFGVSYMEHDGEITV